MSNFIELAGEKSGGFRSEVCQEKAAANGLKG
jgi:hypothetical protein